MQRIEAFEFAPSDKNTLVVALYGATWNEPMQRKLLKTTDNGQTWTDISLNLTAIAYQSITDVAISPNDPDKIWVTFGGYGNNYTNINRVNYSEDGGQTWRDYSTGLTTFPVNRIVSVLGSPTNELYIATDVGVYYSNDLDTIWRRMGSIYQLPLAIVTDLDNLIGCGYPAPDNVGLKSLRFFFHRCFIKPVSSLSPGIKTAV